MACQHAPNFTFASWLVNSRPSELRCQYHPSRLVLTLGGLVTFRAH
jgi:hypothetical protein